LRKPQHAKPLADSIKTRGDWIRVKRQEKNLAPGHLAAKMGIASTLVRSWEHDQLLPTEDQWEALAGILRMDSMFPKS
jgi:ribosome-binding protein aMBF1 (putative translation factor)